MFTTSARKTSRFDRSVRRKRTRRVNVLLKRAVIFPSQDPLPDVTRGRRLDDAIKLMSASMPISQKTRETKYYLTFASNGSTSWANKSHTITKLGSRFSDAA